MSQARAIQIVNSSGVSGFNTMQTKVLRNLVDTIYADLAAGVDPETLAAALISADATNALVQGSDDLLWVDGA